MPTCNALPLAQTRYKVRNGTHKVSQWCPHNPAVPEIIHLFLKWHAQKSISKMRRGARGGADGLIFPAVRLDSAATAVFIWFLCFSSDNWLANISIQWNTSYQMRKVEQVPNCTMTRPSWGPADISSYLSRSPTVQWQGRAEAQLIEVHIWAGAQLYNEEAELMPSW